jgi:hypothetical protein
LNKQLSGKREQQIAMDSPDLLAQNQGWMESVTMSAAANYARIPLGKHRNQGCTCAVYVYVEAIQDGKNHLLNETAYMTE